jgi:hypothetical protein
MSVRTFCILIDITENGDVLIRRQAPLAESPRCCAEYAAKPVDIAVQGEVKSPNNLPNPKEDWNYLEQVPFLF